MKKLFSILLLLSLMSLVSCQNKSCDVILYNAEIYTVDDAFSKVEALAIKDGRIVMTGKSEEVLDAYQCVKTINLHGNYVYPGFIDAHAHFTGQAELMFRYADLKNASDFDEVIRRLQQHEIQSSDSWLCGRGWDQNDWAGQNWPEKSKLDELWPDKPVYLVRIDGHAAIANSKALALAGINADSKISGGEYQKINGKLTGVLIDNAMSKVRDLIPELTKAQKSEALKMAESLCTSQGLTMVSDAGLDASDIDLLDALHKDGTLKIRVNAMLNPGEENFRAYLKKGGFKTDRLTVNSIKLFADGALGSRGACLLEDYSDDAGNQGFILEDVSYYKAQCKAAYDNDFQVCTHCIGDSALRLMLDVYSDFIAQDDDHRWRIEHAQIVHPDDMARFGALHVIPSIQTTHCTSDMDWAVNRLGERIKTAYAYQELLNQNGWIINGTDFPIEDTNPLFTFYSAVFRTHHDGIPEGGFQMENALNREDALRSMTIWAAKGSFDELSRGSLEKGKFADFVIMDVDLMSADADEVLGTSVLSTWISGEKIY